MIMLYIHLRTMTSCRCCITFYPFEMHSMCAGASRHGWVTACCACCRHRGYNARRCVSLAPSVELSRCTILLRPRNCGDESSHFHVLSKHATVRHALFLCNSFFVNFMCNHWVDRVLWCQCIFQSLVFLTCTSASMLPRCDKCVCLSSW